MMHPANRPFSALPDLCPIVIDEQADAVVAVQLTRRDFEKISFLDQRILSEPISTTSVVWRDVEHAGLNAVLGPNYIFHVGHVGSTLLSRLLGQSPMVFALREPAALRRLAELHGELTAAECPWSPDRFETRLRGFLALWSRTYTPEQRSLLKATSGVSGMAADLLARDSTSRAILLTTRAEVYLATILGGPASRVELRLMAPSRLRRLHRRLGEDRWRLHALSEGEQAAMSWACEMTGLCQAAGAQSEWMDFDDLLVDPAPTLARAMTHLSGVAPADVLAAMVASPYFGRYAKAPEYGYDASLRGQVLDQARAEHGAELRRGLAWLEAAAARYPLIAGAVSASLKASRLPPSA